MCIQDYNGQSLVSSFLSKVHYTSILISSLSAYNLMLRIHYILTDLISVYEYSDWAEWNLLIYKNNMCRQLQLTTSYNRYSDVQYIDKYRQCNGPCIMKTYPILAVPVNIIIFWRTIIPISVCCFIWLLYG